MGEIVEKDWTQIVLEHIVRQLATEAQDTIIASHVLYEFICLSPSTRNEIVNKVAALVLSLPQPDREKLLYPLGHLKSLVDYRINILPTFPDDPRTIEFNKAILGGNSKLFLSNISLRIRLDSQKRPDPELVVFKNPDPQLLAILNPPAPDSNPQP